MKLKLRLALLLMLTFSLALPAVGAMAAYYPSFTIKVFDSAGSGAVIDGVAVEVTGHQMHAYVTDLMYAGSRYSIKWSSKNPGIASVNSKGVITCKKEGYATISVKVTNKVNRLYRMKSFTVGVMSNSASYTSMPPSYKDAANKGNFVIAMSKEIYQKSGKVYTKLYVYNGTNQTIKKSVNLEMSFTDDTSVSPVRFTNIGVRKVALDLPIPPRSLGTSKAVSIGKPGGFNSKFDYLLTACVLAASPSGSKGAGVAELSKILG